MCVCVCVVFFATFFILVSTTGFLATGTIPLALGCLCKTHTFKVIPLDRTLGSIAKNHFAKTTQQKQLNHTPNEKTITNGNT